MQKLRGQAFETMMLVISVIVALAILAVLLNIIGGITGIGQGDPTSLMNTALKNEVTTGYGCSAPQSVTINRGTSIFAKSIQGSITSIQPTDNLYFILDPSLTGITQTGNTFNGGNNQAELSTASLTSNSAQIVFVVCADTQKSPQQFNICIGPTSSSQKVSACAPDEQS